MIADMDATPHDARVLQQLIDERAFTVEALAYRSGYDDKTIYRYLAGERTLPSMVLRAAFELTGDGRIMGLITGAVAVFRIATAKSGARIPPLAEAMATTLDAIERTATSAKYMHTIAQDNRFDASDLTAADKFADQAGRAQIALANALAAIEAYKVQLAQEGSKLR